MDRKLEDTPGTAVLRCYILGYAMTSFKIREGEWNDRQEKLQDRQYFVNNLYPASVQELDRNIDRLCTQILNQVLP
jgi:hypothetical protein